MALFDLNRAGDTPVATLKVAEIEPKNWHRYPTAILTSDLTPAYVPVYTYDGGTGGDDIDMATTNVLVDDRGVGAYTPRNQAQKLAAMVPPVVMAEDIGKDYGPYERGWIEPLDPYGPPPEPEP